MYKQVILIRSDLKMSKGKTAAQTAHASVSAADKAGKKIVEAWKDGGQKKVVLKVKDMEEMMAIKKACDGAKLPNAVIVDAGHTELAPGTTTALAIGPEDEKKIDRITGHLKML